MSRMFTKLLRKLGSWRFAVSLFAVVIVLEFAVLLVGLGGRMREAARTAGDAVVVDARPKPLRVAEARGPQMKEPRPIQGGVSISATGTKPAKARSLTQILGEESKVTGVPANEGPSQMPMAEENPVVAAAGEKAPAFDLSAEDAKKLDQLIREARLAQIQGDIRLCVLKLEAASSIDPNHPAVLYFFGMAYESLKNVDKAREYYMAVVLLREKAGLFLPKAAQRLKNGFEDPAVMRGKMAFGPCQTTRKTDAQDGETVVLHLPVLLAPGEEINNPKDVNILVQFFYLVNGRDIALATLANPSIRFMNDEANWANGEEVLEVTYHMPVLTDEEFAAYGELAYYGYAARLYYKGELLDCEGSPRALVLLEQRLKSASPNAAEAGDGVFDELTEEAVPASDYIDEQATE